MISAYLFSTKRTKQANIINIFRSFIVNSLIILIFPVLFGSGIIWYTFALYEGVILIIAFVLLRRSERNGIIYK